MTVELDQTNPRHFLLAVARIVVNMKTTIWLASDYPGETIEQAWLRKYKEPMPPDSEARASFKYQGRYLRFFPKGRVAVTSPERLPGGRTNDEIREVPKLDGTSASTMLEDKITELGIHVADKVGEWFRLGAE